jgi:hypothetical protein
LQPLLNQIVANSERLTVLIFCDGGAQFSGTPFDDGINGIFQQKLDEQKNARQPFVIVLRSQLGQYTACTVGLPPVPVSLPQFPPLPAPPPPPKLTNAPPPPPIAVAPSLIIIGTNAGASLPVPVANPSPTNLPPTNAPAPPVNQTNATAAPPTNPVVATIIPAAAINASAPPPENPGTGKKFLLLGGGLLVAAVALGMVAWLRSHRKDSSLITRSMNDRR